DADSLTAADTGCAMSKFGTDVAKGNADVIILNNRFDSLVCAIRESRGLIDNIKKALHYLLSCNFAEIITVLLGMIFFGGMPLTAVQILWINLLTDCAPALAISMENADDFVMDKKNHTLISRLFDSKSTLNLVSMTAVMTVSTLVAFAIGGIYGRGAAATMAFLTLGLIQIFNSFNYKSNKSIFNKKVFSNRFMNLSSMLSVFIVIFLSFTPAGFVFGLTILSFGQFLISLALAALVIPASELVKFISKKYL
ncbi:MAG: cation-transporting P-type ATPase, partial [Clostridia bacterium]|nr:cation-transporting P-type ATPase [Clostridia bacterium]